MLFEHAGHPRALLRTVEDFGFLTYDLVGIPRRLCEVDPHPPLVDTNVDKRRVKELGLAGEGRIRINKAGCLDRCELGPVAVVYPEGIWYTFVDREDIDEIIDSHLVGGVPVERLRLP
jgi:(2Fe-2S) ferredoxin